ncbi:MAG TPA: D-2-hydroxyacid dehydrogenase [Opitutaceae bacterium]|jgi:glycerate dehydrogenase
MNNIRIAVLDGEKFEDLSWDSFRALGPVALWERSRREQVVERAHGAQCVLTNKAPLTAEAIASLPDLTYIGVLATGHNVVDGAAARARGIPVCNVPEYGTAAVAQHTFALLLELVQGVASHGAGVAQGRWVQGQADWCYWDRPLVELAGLKLGLVGAGRIAQAVAKIGTAFGMVVEHATRTGGPETLRRVLSQSDVVSLHCPLTPDTKELVRAETLAWMKPGSYLLNTSRGGLVNDQDLADALNAGHLAGAGLDVISTEPPPADHPLLRAKHCVITPHLAWAAASARKRLLETAAGNVRDFLAGRPRNVVNL